MATNPFIDLHTPMLWAALIPEFGREVSYLPGRDELLAVALTVIWKEGAEDEDVYPGRYSNIWVQNADFGDDAPRKGDAVSKDGLLYDVVRIDVMAYGYSRLVLQENNG